MDTRIVVECSVLLQESGGFKTAPLLRAIIWVAFSRLFGIILKNKQYFTTMSCTQILPKYYPHTES